jgi:hypothetical protein
MNISLRLYNGVVYIPTSYRVEGVGFFFTGTPLEAVPVEQAERLQQAILAAIGRGNPPIGFEEYKSQLDRKDHPELKATGVRSWYALDRQTKGSWSLAEKDDLYQIYVWRPRKDRGWEVDHDKDERFPAGTPVDEVIARLIALVQERARE